MCTSCKLSSTDDTTVPGCPNATAFESVLQGVISAPGTTAGVGIVDFQVPAGGFSGSLVLKPVGSYGFGSPYPPTMVDVEVLEEANTDGNFGVATYQPAKAGATTISANLAQVAWFTTKNQAITPASQIGYSALQLNASASAATQVDPSYLRVYYVSKYLPWDIWNDKVFARPLTEC